MNLPSASPDENRKTPASISPMPAKTGERVSARTADFGPNTIAKRISSENRAHADSRVDRRLLDINQHLPMQQHQSGDAFTSGRRLAIDGGGPKSRYSREINPRKIVMTTRLCRSLPVGAALDA